MTDGELGAYITDDIRRVGLELARPPARTFTRRIAQAYPIYLRGYDASFAALDRWMSKLDGFLTYGRQGLFAHDNTHHTLAMAWAAEGCLGEDGRFDRERWAVSREVFETHVVED
jgi:hypothetical protein